MPYLLQGQRNVLLHWWLP